MDQKWSGKKALEFVANTSYNLNDPIPFYDIDDAFLDSFDGIFIPGGHPPMVDLWKNKYLGAILSHFHHKAKPTCAICHGPVALVSANLTDANWIYDGYKMTVFSTAGDQKREKEWGGKLFFYPEDILRDTGGIVVEAPTSQPHWIEDRELLTGQNPFSADVFGDQLVKKMLNFCGEDF